MVLFIWKLYSDDYAWTVETGSKELASLDFEEWVG